MTARTKAPPLVASTVRRPICLVCNLAEAEFDIAALLGRLSIEFRSTLPPDLVTALAAGAVCPACESCAELLVAYVPSDEPGTTPTSTTIRMSCPFCDEHLDATRERVLPPHPPDGAKRCPGSGATIAATRIVGG